METTFSQIPISNKNTKVKISIEISEQEIRRIVKTKPAGTNPLNVTNLKSLNLETFVIFSNLEELKNQLVKNKPVFVLLWTGEISYWQSEKFLDYLHAVVIIGFDDKNVLVNDPAFSENPRTISIVEFLAAWSYSQQMLILIEKPKQQ